jgi:hypothetical protein
MPAGLMFLDDHSAFSLLLINTNVERRSLDLKSFEM